LLELLGRDAYHDRLARHSLHVAVHSLGCLPGLLQRRGDPVNNNRQGRLVNDLPLVEHRHVRRRGGLVSIRACQGRDTGELVRRE